MEGFHGAPRRRNVAFRRGRERSSNRLRNDLRNSASFVRSFPDIVFKCKKVKSTISLSTSTQTGQNVAEREREKETVVIGSIFLLINENWESVKSGRITLTARGDNNFVSFSFFFCRPECFYQVRRPPGPLLFFFFFSQPAGYTPLKRIFGKTRRERREGREGWRGRRMAKSESMPTLWKPRLQDRNSATLEFLGSVARH